MIARNQVKTDASPYNQNEQVFHSQERKRTNSDMNKPFANARRTTIRDGRPAQTVQIKNIRQNAPLPNQRSRQARVSN